MTPLRAEPCFFGPQERPLFGWVHPTPEPSPLGLVICNPLGYEAVCSHRSVLGFATEAASNGIPALRFDYDGTGDSAGDDLDPGRLEGWLQSIRSAVQMLKNQTGVQQVCLLGIRMGATLAALISTESAEIAGLIALVPVVDVRTYLRELRALALAGTHSEPPAWANAAQDLQETAGFAFTRETRDDLTRINLSKHPPAVNHGLRQVLVIDRDDLAGNAAWVEQLRQAGAQVEHERLPGYTQMMLDSHEASVPTKMVTTATAWLKKRRDSLPPPDVSRPVTASPLVKSVQFKVGASERPVRETAMFVDAHATVFGVLTEPAAAAAEPLPLVVLLNSGAVHHIGPNRFYVALARSWSAAGAIVLRMDIAGIGDSPNHPGEPENQVYSPHAIQDLTSAIRFVREHRRIGSCHAVGLCSGAYHGFKAAVAGVPFDSVVAINPLTFAWRAGMSMAFPEYRVAADVMRYRRNAFQLASWTKLLKGQVDLSELAQVLVRRMIGVANTSALNLARLLRIPLANDLGTQLQKLSHQKTSMLFVFAQGEPGLELLRDGGGIVVERLKRRGLLRIEMIDSADHTFTPSWSRQKLIQVLDAHMQRQTGLPG